MRMGKRSLRDQMGFNFPLRAPGKRKWSQVERKLTLNKIYFQGMRFASKRTVDTENSTEAGSSKLMVGLVDKRKPGMEFLGKR